MRFLQGAVPEILMASKGQEAAVPNMLIGKAFGGDGGDGGGDGDFCEDAAAGVGAARELRTEAEIVTYMA